MTDVSTRYYDSTFNGLMAQIGLSVGVSVVCLACFEYNRRKKTLDYLYSPRCRLSVDPSPPVSRKLLGWIIPTVKLKEDSILTMLVWTQSSSQTCPGTLTCFGAHVFLTYVISLSWMFLLFKNYWQWMDLRREYTLQRIRHGEIAERSIFISRLPSNLRSDAALKQYFESLKMGPVESATVVKDCGRLSQKLDRRDSALNRLEKAHIDLARSVLENVKSGHFPEEAATVIVSDKSHATSSSTTVDYATLQQLVQDLYKDRKHYNKVRKSISAIERALATRGNKDTSMVAADINQPTTAKQILETTATSETVVARHDLDTIDIVVHQEPESIAPFRTGLQEPETSTVITTGRYNDPGKNSIWHILASLRRQDLDAFQPTRTEKRFKSGERVDSIDYFLKKFNRLDRKIEELRDGSLRYKSTSFGFVTFKHHLSAQLPQGLSVRLAMEPRDVLWSNLTVSFRNRFTRTVAVNLSSWALIIFWIFPTSSFLLLMSLTQLSQRFKFLEPILEASPLIQSLIQNVLPIIFVTIFLALAPVIILAISKQELPVSHSELEGKVLQRYYHFLIFNVLFVFMIGSAVVKSIISILQEPTNIFKLLADLLPSGSTIFRILHHLQYLYSFSRATSSVGAACDPYLCYRKETNRNTSIPSESHHPLVLSVLLLLPQNILAFVITLIYSIISPLILLAAVFFFGFALLIFKYQLAYCYIRRYENSGRYFRHVFQYTSDGLIIFNVTMIGVLWLNEAVVGGFLIVVLLGFTIYFKITRTKYLPLDTGLRNFGPEPDPTGPDTELRSNILSTSVGSTSTRSCASSAASTSGRGGLRKRHIGENAQTAATSVASLGNLTSEGLADLGSSDPVGSSSGSGGSGSSNLGLSQPKTFSRLRPAAVELLLLDTKQQQQPLNLLMAAQGPRLRWQHLDETRERRMAMETRCMSIGIWMTRWKLILRSTVQLQRLMALVLLKVLGLIFVQPISLIEHSSYVASIGPSQYTFFPAQNHSGSGAGTVSGSSIHITQPKNARGFLNMIFGGLNHDDDNDDDDGDGRPTGTDKPQFGYETGEDDTDDDEDEDVPKALGSSSANAAVSGTGDGDGNSKDGLEESQKTPSPAANLDLTETLPVPKRTMSFWRDSDKPDRSGV
ncbi:hypothetical protein BCR41DRAFT_356884 [Lobosporangium transversale]|uniref:Uncharacterized protein n=1 Tax=Lobosporangium transversale TaxID=64571 RepID=A0A1Y2GJY9_9FUNG|nr:hypothetical protein BCR41DRAFT_356884 [Lobosporangium transversale]ORZ11755.1 hypothetical protein BCR41DRAFT_356884 [Lobosporangium transversale]|eukprot:XP_021879852.1 hypothetical protein BCR41DRAFT_356884 [Lobosporangium transversale]